MVMVEAGLLVDPQVIGRLAAHTMRREWNSRFTPSDLGRFIRAEHSPVRALLLEVGMYGIAPETSVHFCRHKVGVEHFVTTSRPDRTGVPRGGTVDHIMVCNPQALVNMGRRRLCNRAEAPTLEAMRQVRDCLLLSDGWLREVGMALVPDCVYRGRCFEVRPCVREKG